ncbi:Lipoprotein-releasing system ATP-binding protein LolD [Austwickia sp. TVS 96-490-7B]|uniref:ABC transporter ATP-binding protein n=1 Tax=Austwickia sp. TVS 96-490-7B TaxID=2830843 RepID=UPI001C595AF4|nr:ABC transporter ATP-binding protein [Austwickia sp. TVS 96-490-7B]MBW3086591.1 Lipoprotein-releasing system ATP-binding protein LolD [Austwickia sp. TVS 96-490-7B]
MTPALLNATDLHVRYGDTPALTGIGLQIDRGENVAVMGPSGSGKSTLLHCLAGIVVPDRGQVILDGRDLSRLGERDRSRRRLAEIGVVFQFGDLIAELTVVENVALPARLLGVGHRDALRRSLDLLDQLDIADVASRRVGAVSGGQAQRVAIARALINEPLVILADEPTGALDSVTSQDVMDLLCRIAREAQAALVVVTHDHLVASHMERHIVVRDGRIAGRVPAAVGEG